MEILLAKQKSRESKEISYSCSVAFLPPSIPLTTLLVTPVLLLDKS